MKNEILRIHNLSVDYGGCDMVENISFSLAAGEVIGFMGLNDSGKDFLTKILLGQINEYASGAFLCGKRLSSLALLQSAVYLVCRENYTFQTWTVAEFIGLVDYKTSFLPFRQIGLAKAVTQFLSGLEIDIEPHKKLHQLSNIELRLLDVARALYQNRRLIIIWEAFDDFTNEDSGIFKRTLKPLLNGRAALIINTQSKPALNVLSDTLYFFNKGCIWKKLKNQNLLLTTQFLEASVHGAHISKDEQTLPFHADCADLVLTLQNFISTQYGNAFYLRRGNISLLQIMDYEERLLLFNHLSGRNSDAIAGLRTDKEYRSLNSYEEFVQHGIVSIQYEKQELLDKMSVVDNLLMPSIGKFDGFSYLLYRKKLVALISDEVARFSGRNIAASKTITFHEQLIVYYERWLIYKPKVLILLNPFFQCDANDVVLVKNYILSFLSLGTHVIVLQAHRDNLEAFDEVLQE